MMFASPAEIHAATTHLNAAFAAVPLSAGAKIELGLQLIATGAAEVSAKTRPLVVKTALDRLFKLVTLKRPAAADAQPAQPFLPSGLASAALH